jgi:coenzyme F420-reducing hydrogenase alpha subunit
MTCSPDYLVMGMSAITFFGGRKGADAFVRKMEDVTGIVSRICAICSTNHTITSLHALENALGVTVTPQTRRLRDLAYQGANIESHALHVFVLDLPDLMGHSSVISLAGVIPEAVKIALRLKKLGTPSRKSSAGGRFTLSITS